MNTFKTRNIGLAATFRYLFGSVAHLGTKIDLPHSPQFEFDDCEDRCRPVMLTYQRADGGSGFAIQDARTLIDESYIVRETVRTALANGGEWRNQ